MDTVIINYQYNLIRTHSRIKHFIIVHNHILYNDSILRLFIICCVLTKIISETLIKTTNIQNPHWIKINFKSVINFINVQYSYQTESTNACYAIGLLLHLRMRSPLPLTALSALAAKRQLPIAALTVIANQVYLLI